MTTKPEQLTSICGTWGGVHLGLTLGIEIDPESGRCISTETHSAINAAMNDIKDRILGDIDAKSAATIAEIKATRRRIEGLFSDWESGNPIYVEEIPNGYSQDYYYRNRPWYRITTTIGHFVVGWRKRVLNIDWSETTCKKSARVIFPDKDLGPEQYIHADTYESASHYIRRIFDFAE